MGRRTGRGEGGRVRGREGGGREGGGRRDTGVVCEDLHSGCQAKVIQISQTLPLVTTICRHGHERLPLEGDY